MLKDNRLTAQFWLGCLVTIAGLTLLFVGCFVPPVGIIDSSLLVAFGEVATFAGALIGIDVKYKYESFLRSGKNDESK